MSPSCSQSYKMGNCPFPVPAFLPGKGMPLRQCWPGFQLCISLWVLRNTFLRPGQGMPTGRVTSGPAHKVKSAPLKYKTSKQPLDRVQILDGSQNSKQSLMAFSVQRQACLIIIFSTFLRLVIMYLWFTVLMSGNCVTFILPCRITWEYSLERISHWAKVKKQDMQQAPRCLPISLKYKWFPGIKDSEIHSHKVKALLSK